MKKKRQVEIGFILREGTKKKTSILLVTDTILKEIIIPRLRSLEEKKGRGRTEDQDLELNTLIYERCKHLLKDPN